MQQKSCKRPSALSRPGGVVLPPELVLVGLHLLISSFQISGMYRVSGCSRLHPCSRCCAELMPSHVCFRPALLHTTHSMLMAESSLLLLAVRERYHGVYKQHGFAGLSLLRRTLQELRSAYSSDANAATRHNGMHLNSTCRVRNVVF